MPYSSTVALSFNKKIETLKRGFDILFVVLIFPFAFFFLLIGALLIKFSSKGPIIFKQARVGKNGKVFNIYKLRTMVFCESGHLLHTVENDERIFPVGAILRKTKIDELPQIYNILFGDMSLIGPRPERKEIVEELIKKNERFGLRHLIRPGITGWAQVNNPTATPEHSFEKLEYDLYYIKNASLYLDLKILLKTVKIVLTRNSL